MNHYIDKHELSIISNSIFLTTNNQEIVLVIQNNNSYITTPQSEEILQGFSLPLEDESLNLIKEKIELFFKNKEEIKFINTITKLQSDYENKPIGWHVDEIDRLKKIKHEISQTYPEFYAHIDSYEKLIINRSFQGIQNVILQLIYATLIIPFNESLNNVIQSRGHFFSWDNVYLEYPHKNIVHPETIKNLIYLYKDSMSIEKVTPLVLDFLNTKPKNLTVNKTIILDQDMIELYFSQKETTNQLSINLVDIIKKQGIIFDFSKFEDDPDLSIKWISDFEGTDLFLGISDQIHILHHNKTNITISEIEDTLKNPDKVWISHKAPSLTDKVYQKGDKQIAILDGIIKTASKSDKLREGYSILYAERTSDGYSLYDVEVALLFKASNKHKGTQGKFEILARAEQDKDGVKHSDIRVPGTTKENLAPKSLQNGSVLDVWIDGQKVDAKDFNLKIVKKFIPLNKK